MEPKGFEGKYIQTPRDVTCDRCDHIQQVMIPVKIDRVEGDKGYGPGGVLMTACERCGAWFEVDRDSAKVQIDTR